MKHADLTNTTAKSTADVMRWIIANEHHEGYWRGTPEKPVALVLRGDRATLTIPASVHVPEMMQPADVVATKRMYEPTPAGLRALQESDPAAKESDNG